MTLPKPIQNHLMGYTTTGKNHRTSSQSRIYLYQHQNLPDLFLKINTGHTDKPLILEKLALEWVQDKLPVPRIVAYNETNDAAYLLTQRIPGISAASEMLKSDKQTTIRILAEGLRTIHNTSTQNCPLPPYTADDLILQAEHNVKTGLIMSQSLKARGDTRTPQEALAQVRSLHPSQEHITFTHGDYCLPNIMIHNGNLSGFIDWGSAGLGDPHRDFVSAQYSIRRNLGEEWVEPFFNIYGREHLNKNTLAFYSAIYELT